MACRRGVVGKLASWSQKLGVRCPTPDVGCAMMMETLERRMMAKDARQEVDASRGRRALSSTL